MAHLGRFLPMLRNRQANHNGTLDLPWDTALGQMFGGKAVTD